MQLKPYSIGITQGYDMDHHKNVSAVAALMYSGDWPEITRMQGDSRPVAMRTRPHAGHSYVYPVYRVRAWRKPNEDWPKWSIALQRAAPTLPVLSDQTELWLSTGRLGC